MRCVNPRRLPNKACPMAIGREAYINVPCGKCYACLSNRRRAWLYRLQVESLNSVFTHFLTLTYDDNCLPADLQLEKHELQKFIKKLRNYDDFRYYAIGEFGTHTHRPHYHLVIFYKSFSTFCNIDDYQCLYADLWNYGFVYASNATYRRLNYILHYHTRPKLVDGRDTFALYSKGLGIDFIDPAFVRWFNETHNSIIHDFNGNTYVIPRYYRKKLQDIHICTPDGIVYNDDQPFTDFFDHDQWFFDFTGKHFNQVSSLNTVSLLKDIIKKDYNRLNNYNNQDKYT